MLRILQIIAGVVALVIFAAAVLLAFLLGFAGIVCLLLAEGAYRVTAHLGRFATAQKQVLQMEKALSAARKTTIDELERVEHQVES